MSRPFISIIVPVLNESALIRAFLECLRAVAPSGWRFATGFGGASGGSFSELRFRVKAIVWE
jgi:hypothetical protein